MAFCGKCGTQVDEGIKFCPSCGGEVGASAEAAPTAIRVTMVFFICYYFLSSDKEAVAPSSFAASIEAA